MVFDSMILDVHIKSCNKLANAQRGNRVQRSGPRIYPRCKVRLLMPLIVPVMNKNGEFISYTRWKKYQEFEADITANHAKIRVQLDNIRHIEYAVELLHVELI